MVVKFDWKKFLISVIIPLSVGGLSALITGRDMDIYKDIVRPKFSPPSWVFPVVWTILYFLMGVSLYLVIKSKKNTDNKKISYFLFGSQLLLNFLWSPVFFSRRWFLFAIVILVLLIINVILMIISFKKHSKAAAYLQIPYVIWLFIALYLNVGIYILN